MHLGSTVISDPLHLGKFSLFFYLIKSAKNTHGEANNMHGLTHFQQAYHQKSWVRLPNWPVYCRMVGTKIIYCYWVRVNFCLEVQSYPNWYLCNTILTHKTWGKSWRRGRKILRPRCPGCLLLDTVSASHNKGNTHKISAIWLPEQNQHKDTTHW